MIKRQLFFTNNNYKIFFHMRKHKRNDKLFVEKTYTNFYRHKLTNNNKDRHFSSLIFFVEKFKKFNR